MHIKSILRVFTLSLLATACGSNAFAGAVFPSVADPGGPYDGVADSFEFNVSGTFVDVGNDGLNAGDQLLILMKPFESDGTPIDPDFGFVVGATFDGAGGFTALSQWNGAAASLSTLFGSTVGAIDGSALAVGFGSMSLDFSSITNPTDLNDGDVNAEFSVIDNGSTNLSALTAVISGAEILFGFDLLGDVAANNLAALGTPTNFLPQSQSAGFPPSNFDYQVALQTSGIDSKVFAAPISSGTAGTGSNGGGIGDQVYTIDANGLAIGDANPVPEPGSIFAMLACLGVAGLVKRRRRRDS